MGSFSGFEVYFILKGAGISKKRWDMDTGLGQGVVCSDFRLVHLPYFNLHQNICRSAPYNRSIFQ